MLLFFKLKNILYTKTAFYTSFQNYFKFYVCIYFCLCWVDFSLIVVKLEDLTVAAPLLEPRQGLQGAWASVAVARGLRDRGSRALECWISSCGTWAQLPRGMWNLSGLGIQPVCRGILYH